MQEPPAHAGRPQKRPRGPDAMTCLRPPGQHPAPPTPPAADAREWKSPPTPRPGRRRHGPMGDSRNDDPSRRPFRSGPDGDRPARGPVRPRTGQRSGFHRPSHPLDPPRACHRSALLSASAWNAPRSAPSSRPHRTASRTRVPGRMTPGTDDHPSRRPRPPGRAPEEPADKTTLGMHPWSPDTGRMSIPRTRPDVPAPTPAMPIPGRTDVPGLTMARSSNDLGLVDCPGLRPDS